ncbi:MULTISPECIES: 3-oxoacyl-[acyl-carrier-protein] reductase [Brucella]|uniref:3-oxoacyl-[acyl-carrier-protein] reductase n=23 Tax=Brucella TaxID=234 RepID=Q2YMG6_BRUA2|nr:MULTISPECIES: 3-oxoacyl-[acyl-carrier-protein] reductase [Brucella]EPZ75597.1 3-oxoacyl-ACP synthase [Brucella melitensis ADMAS-G1]ERM86251.1 3-oxoacyl-ACP synthase [Brucella abortus 82]ERT85564.1 nodulation protein G [Brucella abortus 90-12178]ERT97725.1 nodulation protein G [Brucella abortus 99-9971-135]ERU00737.1 nodulation protein G [Brucella abortus 07-0994-2411]EXU84518.1 3-oxoacyl-ACP synthase [Brucella melitensis 548]KFH21088.1 3-oxoacyl-ACP synthase [Brucella abortus LMN1]KFH227
MFDLTGRKALVTGATGGLGEAIARALHAQGAIVGLHGTREEKLKELAAELGERIFVFPANLSDREAVKALGQKAEEEMGGVDILVNNAGITRDGLFVRMSDEDWDAVLTVNLTSVFNLTRELTHPMMRRRNGRIINITSIVGVTGNPGQANYCASKAGLIGFSKSLAQEIASRNVTVNCIAPGFIESAMTGKLNEKQKDAIMGNIPMKRMGVGADIAAAVVYLASDEAAYVTGQTLHVNGGMAMI